MTPQLKMYSKFVLLNWSEWFGILPMTDHYTQL